MSIIFYIFNFIYASFIYSVYHLNWDIINGTLILLIILSVINFFNELFKLSFSAEAIQESVQKTFHEQKDLIEDLRSDLFIERVRANYLALIYFSSIKAKKEYNIAYQHLEELGIDKKILKNPKKFDIFFQKLSNKEYSISFDKTTNKFILKEKIINNNKENKGNKK